MGEQKRKAASKGNLFERMTPEEGRAAEVDAQSIATDVIALLQARSVRHTANGGDTNGFSARVILALPSILGYAAAGIAEAHGAGTRFLGDNWLLIQRETNKHFLFAMAQYSEAKKPKH